MKWIYKAIIQKAISFLPLSHRINLLFQRYITVGKELPDAFVIDRLNHARNHINSFNKYGSLSISNANVLEIGTGWYPIVPVAFFLSGANNIETTDIRRLYTIESINKTFRAIIKLHSEHVLDDLIPNFQENRITILNSVLRENSISFKLNMLHIKSTICTYTDLIIKSNSKDIIVSNNTIQLIEKKKISCFFSELARIGRNKSLMSLHLDLTDEFSHFDSSISNYNFYKFSELDMKLIFNRLSFPNRLRYPDYKDLISGVNLNIIEEEIIKGEEQELSNIVINKSFSKYSITDLLIKQVRFVAIVNK